MKYQPFLPHFGSVGGWCACELGGWGGCVMGVGVGGSVVGVGGCWCSGGWVVGWLWEWVVVG